VDNYQILFESNEKYKTLLENLNDILFELDSQGNFIYISPAVEKVTGFNAQEILGRHIGSFIHPDDINGLQMGFEINQEGQIEPRAFRHKKKEGNWIYLRITSHVVLRNGKQEGITGVMTDVTQSKNAETALKNSEEYFRTLMENASDLIIALKEDASIQYATPSVTKVIGYAVDDVIGQNISKYIYPGDSLQATRLFINASCNPGNTGQIELRFKHSDGTVRYAEIIANNALENPAVHGIILNIHDVTDHKKIEGREKELEQELQISSRLASIGQLAAGIAHEINNPLTSVIGFSKLLTRKELPEDVMDKIKIINTEAQRVAKIVQGLLTFARQDELQRGSVDINAVLSQILQLRSYEMSTNNIKVNQDFARDLPNIQADTAQLQQVFLNIILNAEKEMNAAHGKGNLVIKTEKTDFGVQVSVKDDGPGISPENMPRLFTPFFTTRKIGEGTGLGLSICHGIITRHGGKISVQSKLGDGATFIVELPLGAPGKNG
jgi:two-component system NtrC family sensor kinase